MCFVLKTACPCPQAGLSQALNFADGQLCASITYRREIPQKVTTIFKISKKNLQNH